MRASLFALAATWLIGCGGAAPKGGPLEAGPTAAGPQVVLQPTGSPIIEFRIVFRAGSAFDPADKAGLGQLLATAMVEGGTEALTYPELLATLHPWAAKIEVQVDREQVVFIGRCHRDHLEQFYPIFRDVLLRPRLAQADVERLKKKALETLTRKIRTGDDEELSKLVLETVLYAGHPYGHPSIGTEAGLAAITRDDVVAHRAAVMAQDRLVIGLGGGADEALAARVRADLGTLPRQGSAPLTLPPAPKDQRRLVIVDQPDANSTAISLGHTLPITRADADFPALALIASYFGEHRQFHGVLFQTIREQRGMNYGDYAYAEAFRQEGWARLPLANIARQAQYFSVWIRPVPQEDRLFALRIAQWNLDRLLANGVPAEAFAKTRDFLNGYIYLAQQSDQRRLGYAIDDRFYGLAKRSLDTLREGWAKLTAPKVDEALRKYIHPDVLTTVVVTADAQSYADAVRANTPSPKTYASPKPEAIVAEDAEIAARPFGYTADQITIVKSSELFAH